MTPPRPHSFSGIWGVFRVGVQSELGGLIIKTGGGRRGRGRSWGGGMAGEREVGSGRGKWGGGEEKEIGGEMGVKKGKNDKGKWKREGGK